MKKLIKNIIGISFSLMLLFSSCTQVMEAASETYIRMSFPASGRLYLKPFSATQIDTTAPAYFANIAPDTADTVYKVSLAGYTCVVDPRYDDYPIDVTETVPNDDTWKCFSAKLELGEAQDLDNMTTDLQQFRDRFVSSKTLAVTSLQDASYNGKKVTSYEGNPVRNDSVSIEPQQCVPFRITGEMNELAKWFVGDKIIIVPIFQITVSKR